MEYKIKCKIIDGKEVYGIINESIEEVAPFKYVDISEVFISEKSDFHKEEKCWALKKEDGTIDIMYNGSLFETDYNEIIKAFLPTNSFSLYIVTNSKNKDLISFSYAREKCIMSKMKSEKYDNVSFVKEDDAIAMYRNTEDGELKGYYNHPKYGYLEADYVDIIGYYGNSKETVSYDKDKDHFKNTFDYDKSYTKFIIASKYVDGKLKWGVLVRKTDKYDRAYFEELIPFEYDAIEYDIYGFKVTKNNKQKILGYTEEYCEPKYEYSDHLGSTEFVKTFETDEYDSIDMIQVTPSRYGDGNNRIFYNTCNKGKYGLVEVLSRRNHKNYSKILEMLPCKYDEPVVCLTKDLNLPNYIKCDVCDAFEMIENGKAGVIFNVTKNDVFQKTECVYDRKINLSYNNRHFIGITYTLTQDDKSTIVRANYYDGVKMTSPLRKHYIVDKGNGYFIIKGLNENDKYNIYKYQDNNEGNIVLVAEDVEEFKKESAGYVSINKIADNEVYKFYDNYLDLVETIIAPTISYASSEVLDAFIVLTADGARVISLSNVSKALEGEYEAISVAEDYITYINKGEKAKGIKKIKDGKIIDLCVPSFAIIFLIPEIKRAIVSDINTGKQGVIELTKGNICIEKEYDTVDCSDDMFICKKDNTLYYFDTDGFVVPAPKVIKK